MNTDLVFIKTSNTPTQRVEVHIASAISDYKEFIEQTPTAFKNELDGVWQILSNGDLAFIKTANTPNNHVEVHIVSAALQYNQFIVQLPTAFASSEDGIWQILSNGDLALIKVANTPDRVVEIQINSAENNYRDLSAPIKTAFRNKSDGIWQLLGNRDLAFIKTSNTSHNFVEVQIASAVSGYQTLTPPIQTAFAVGSSGTWQILCTRDLALIKTSDTPNNHVEIHIASAASDYKTMVLQTQTVFLNEMGGTWTMRDPNVMGHIKHVVVMMMENRSFDHIFGMLPGIVDTRWGVAKTERSPEWGKQFNLLDPKQPPGINNPEIRRVDINTTNQPGIPGDKLKFNPVHGFGGMMHDIFGPGTKGFKNGNPITPPLTCYPNAMCGFVLENKDKCTVGLGISTVMETFDYLPPGEPGRLNVLHSLAENFVLCANWFCDTPSKTVPNRYFMHAATNLGVNDTNPKGPDNPNHPMKDEPKEIYQQKTIYQQLDEIAGQGDNWAVYGFEGCSYDTDLFSYTNSNVTPEDKARFAAAHRNIRDLASDLNDGKLPFYTFLMPSLNAPISADGNSMHPSSDIRYGENYIAYVYNLLRTSEQWSSTLFIILFDENGGVYDHITPPLAVPPDEHYYYHKTKKGEEEVLFDYTCLGPRIPVVLVSPCLQVTGSNGIQIDLRQYQNTSVLRFVQDLLSAQKSFPMLSPYLTERDRFAPSFAVSPFWRFGNGATPSPEIVPHPGFNWYYPLGFEPIGECAQSDELSTVPTRDEPATEDAIDLIEQYVAHLPGHPDSGKPLTRAFDSYGALHDYLQERKLAAMQHSTKCVKRTV